MGIEQVILIIFGVAFIAFSLAVMVLAILAYRIAVLYAPPTEKKRRIPTLGQRLRHQAADTDEPGDVIEGTNKWPTTEGEVAEDEAVTQFVGAAEATQATDREKWWEEQREAGYTDEAIGEMEESRIVPVFTADQ